jgi:hypothetical protein
MYNSKLLRLFSLLQAAELPRLADFLRSPYFNQHEKVLDLFELIREKYPQFTHPDLDRKIVFAQIFPGRPFNWQVLKDLMSRLTMLTGRFLAIEKVSDSPFFPELHLLESLSQRGDPNLFGQYRKALLKQMDQSGFRDAAYFESRARIEDFADRLKGLEMKREFWEGLQEKAAFSNVAFLIRKLQDYCEMLNRNNIHRQHYRPELLAELQEIIRRHPAYLEIPAVDIWYRILQTLLFPDDDTVFQSLMERLERYEAVVRPEELRGMFKYALNFCIRQINAGKEVYLQESLRVYRKMLAEKLLHINGRLSHTDFKNIATSGIRLKAYDWVEDFINRYKGDVAPPHAENVFTYCLAYLYAESGKEREAFRLLQEVQFTDAYYALSSRNLLLRLYFENGDFEALTYQIQAYRLFLKRNGTLSARNRNLYLAFAKYLQKLTRLTESRFMQDEKNFHSACLKLREELSAKAAIANQGWLMERLDMLML